MTDDEILAIAARKGHFRVTHRYRDDKLRGRCERLVRARKLYVMPAWKVRKKLHDDPRCATFFAPAEQKAEQAA